MGRFVGAIDQGTTSTRFLIFDRKGAIIGSAQKEHEQLYPKPGWVEHNPMEIWRNTAATIADALAGAGLSASDLAAVGVANQRETTVLWDRRTGEPLYNAIVWQDTRTARRVTALSKEGGQDRLRAKTGLLLATYFSGLKLAWILENVPGAREKAQTGDALFGTMDSWLVWLLSGGLHVTDATNASRTQMMNLATLDWDGDLLSLFDVPRACLPAIAPSSRIYAEAKGVLEGVPIAGILGDQHAALFGQACLKPGEAKNTYGTGCFMLLNTGESMVQSSFGLLTTLGYQLDGQKPIYALEGSIAITGALVQWLRDNLGFIQHSSEIETLARSVDDNGGVYFVPAFSGLYAPHWKEHARGVICGLTRFVNKGHIARAALEATAFQTREVLDAMAKESGVAMTELRVDGGMVVNDTLMQFQADMLNAPVVRPQAIETTALGAAYAAGLAVGYWNSLDDIVENWSAAKRWHPAMKRAESDSLYRSWQKAVSRSLDWAE